MRWGPKSVYTMTDRQTDRQRTGGHIHSPTVKTHTHTHTHWGVARKSPLVGPNTIHPKGDGTPCMEPMVVVVVVGVVLVVLRIRVLKK